MYYDNGLNIQIYTEFTDLIFAYSQIDNFDAQTFVPTA